MKMLISHLCERNGPVATRLAEQNEHDPIEEMSEDRLIHFLGTALNNMKARTYVFVDGLDECTGDYGDLVYFLEKLQNKTPIRMCLASRPEPILKRYCARFPSFAMQDYNATSIKAYIKHAVQSAEDRLVECQAIRDTKLQDAIVRKAQGVIIWARFAIDCLLRVGQRQVSLITLEDALDKLPEDLDRMYERTLRMIPDNVSIEAALLLHFLLKGRVELKVLYGFWHWFFLTYRGMLPSDPALEGDAALAPFAVRLQQILGSFISTVKDHDDLIPDPHPYCKPDFYGDQDFYYDPKKRKFRRRIMPRSLPLWKLNRALHSFSMSTTTTDRLDYVQITHKTIADFLRDSDYFQSLVPLEMRRTSTLHMAAKILASVTAQGDIDLTMLFAVFKSLGTSPIRHVPRNPSSRSCELLVRDLVQNSIWKHRAALVRHCIFRLTRCAESPHLDPEVFRAAFESPLLLLDFGDYFPCAPQSLCAEWISNSTSFVRLLQFVSLSLIVRTGQSDYLRGALDHSTMGSALLPQDWNMLLIRVQTAFKPYDNEIYNLIAPHCSEIPERLRARVEAQAACTTANESLASAIDRESSLTDVDGAKSQNG
ncbi:hypothetical protein F5Y18DRAFT_307075 [Xylariaceae sp. FL1019]|nr:hypothetical protein F5Y18DRAFT_307075 [Xylariaceae sp. FL1019]